MWMWSMSSQPSKQAGIGLLDGGSCVVVRQCAGNDPLEMWAVGIPPLPPPSTGVCGKVHSQPNERMLPEDSSRANWSDRCARRCRRVVTSLGHSVPWLRYVGVCGCALRGSTVRELAGYPQKKVREESRSSQV
ncbi:hypothetical protein B0T18DRAFT_189128 [Schizothecium vesticola]|uniref:Uncharacterized protein n=1 Tax=Schizothecium vesticola TaxID=314040 RepID=A0AA40EQK7_9PEZI|nr:hypothetical protein B0T18DRAFT_189128 [Schizothecium vesticola]